MAHPSDSADQRVYSGVARFFHWVVVAFVAVMVPVGLLMTYRGKTLEIWDATTNALYSGHKLAGFILLFLVAARLIYRLVRGRPADEPTLEPWQRVLSHIVHWALYAVLLAVPILGWIGVSKFPALDVFGLFKLPAITTPDKEGAAAIFEWHETAAWLLVALVTVHIGAALYHHFVRRDGVLARMMPSVGRRRA